MADDSNKPDPTDTRFARLKDKGNVASQSSNLSLPPSKPLQFFLLIAIVVTGAAYVVGEWTDMRSRQTQVKETTRLKRLVLNQSKFLDETKLGHTAEEKKQYDQAVLHYRKALEAQDIGDGHFHLGAALLKQGSPDAAFAQFKEALREDPSLVAVYSTWGQALMTQGKPDEAAAIYREALQANPNLGAVHFSLGQALEEQARSATAAEAQHLEADAGENFARAAALGFQTPEFLTTYGTFLNKQGKFAEAEASLSHLDLQKPGLGEAQFQLGVADEKLGKTADAIGHYEATLAARPDDPAVLNNLALIYLTATNMEARSPKMAVQLATRACEATTSQNAHFVDTLARAYAADGDFFEAIAWEQKAIRRAAQLNQRELLGEFNARYALFVQHKTE
jgi:tetratricopeptide (TPR) repeat protein